MVARRPLAHHLYSAYLVSLAALPVVVLSVEPGSSAPASGPLSHRLVPVALPVGLVALALATGRRDAPLLLDRPTLVLKTRTARPNGTALAGDVAVHVGAVMGLALVVGLLIVPELERAGSWAGDVGLRVLSVVGLATAAFGLALALVDRLWSVRTAIVVILVGLAGVAWVAAVEASTAATMLVIVGLAGGLFAVAVGAGALEGSIPDRLIARARVLEDVKTGWALLTPVHVWALLRTAHRAVDRSSLRTRRWRPSPVRLGVLILAMGIAASMVGGAPLRVGALLGVLAYLLGSELTTHLTFLAQVSRSAPLTIPPRHLAGPAMVLWLVAVLLGATGAMLIAWASGPGPVIGVAFAATAAGVSAALWSSTSRGLDLGTLLSSGGSELVGLVVGSRWVLPPLAVVIVAAAAASLATADSPAPNGLMVACFVGVLLVAPPVSVRP